MNKKIYIVETDNYHREGTLFNFKSCIYDETDKYHVIDKCLYYGNILIGVEKENEK